MAASDVDLSLYPMALQRDHITPYLDKTLDNNRTPLLISAEQQAQTGAVPKARPDSHQDYQVFIPSKRNETESM